MLIGINLGMFYTRKVLSIWGVAGLEEVVLER